MSDIPHNAVTQVGPSMAPKLEATQGENKGETFKVKLTTRLGRERDNDVVLLDLKSSRHHAEVKLDDGQWVLVDLGSANGTLLNNKPVIQPSPLKHGDRIGIGETELVFTLPGEPDIEPPAPVPAVAAAVAWPPIPADVPRRGAASGQIPVVTPPPKRTPPPRLAFIAGGVILLVCAVAMVIIYFATNKLVYPSTSTSENIPPPSQNSTPISNPGGQDTSASTQPPEARPTGLALVYEDDFSDSFGGWDDAFDEYTRKVYGNNRYNIEVNASNLVAWGLANRIVSDFEVEVEAKQEDGSEENSYGLLFRFQDRDNFYRFDISGDGYYLFSKFVNGEWVTLVDWAESEFINTGNVPNILKVSAFGPNITLSVNGQQLTTLVDDSIERGNFGFFARTFAEPVSWVSFDNLKMSTQPNEEIVLVPTATPIGATPIGQSVAAATPSLTPTPVPPTPEPAETVTTESESASESPVATPTATARPTPEPTPTPPPLAEYVSRDQTLARGETKETAHIVFPVYDSKGGIYDIYMADVADGDNLTLIQKSASQPALTQDGSEIAYRSWQPDKRGLFARAIGADPLDAWGFDLFFESARPQFSPADSSLMYFSRTSGTEPATYRIIDGVSNVMRRDGAPIQGKSPKWSSDGQQFVYSGCNGSTCGIISSNVDGGAPAQLTDNPSDTNPEISPDGSTIVFMSDRGGNWEIYRMDIDGQNLKALTTDKASDGLPTWSPDGSKIAFVSNRDGEWSVWVMGADGSDKRRQFVVEGIVDGIVQHDVANSFGWTEENIDWIP